MKEGTRHLLEKAERAIQAAEVLLGDAGAEFCFWPQPESF